MLSVIYFFIMKAFRISIKKVFIAAFLFLSADFFIFAEPLKLPVSSTTCDNDLAIKLLELCTGHTKENTKKIFSDYGLNVLTQKNYKKPQSQTDHTSAYTIGCGNILQGAEKTKAYIIVVRGTDGNEWFSDFNISPAKDDSSHFTENFLLSAEEIFLDCTKLISDKKSVIVVAGHSRGAAVANILAVLMNETYKSSNVYAYTFACPATIKKIPDLTENNIFNYINPCDIVPHFPFASWGFRRAGKDIILDSESDNVSSKRINNTFTAFSKICPSVSSFYSDKHSLTSPGLSENGLTFYELLMCMAVSLSNLTSTDFNFSLPQVELDSDLSLLLNSAQKFPALINEHLPDSYKTKIERIK